mmetsp:Transcript_30162/g.43081  ORF Transcript_30162/g.43081 Transcript_30162/m.43081 type:complete len:115 (+) Transcript_30162:429-773(+)
MFRDNAGAFLSDANALRIALNGIEKNLDIELTPFERSVYYMPLMHSEDITIHEKFSIPKFEELAQLGKSMNMKHAIGHANIIRTCGRYPARNTALKRTSTPVEEEFMKANPGGY